MNSTRLIGIKSNHILQGWLEAPKWRFEFQEISFYPVKTISALVMYGSFHVKSATWWTACSQILLKFCIQFGIWKKIPEPEDERSETSEAGDMAPESFRYFEISRTASIFQMALTSLFLKIAPKNFQFWIGNHKPVIWR